MAHKPYEVPQVEKIERSFPKTGYVRLSQILAPEGPLPISKSGFWAGVKAGIFPKSRKISPRVTVWRAEDINALLNDIERRTP